MSAVGIICEYNPFHEGHKYHIEKAREKTGADTVVAVMNGDFVQRGEPAVADKYTRARMALEEGADMVFELPVRYGISSAEDFAYGGILALHSLGFVDTFCFGSEGAEEDALTMAGHFFAEESEAYQKALNRFLREGLSYPVAREYAFAECTGMQKEQREVLFSPNNILGTEYIKAAIQLNTHMKPVVIKRQGLGYNEDKPGADGDFLSATAIRNLLFQGGMAIEGIPAGARKIFNEAAYLETEDFWQICAYGIREKWNHLEHIKDVSDEMANAFRKNWYDAVSLEDFVNRCKSKNITMSRVKRCMFQILLGIEKEERERTLPYIRLLGMKKDASSYLGKVEETVVLGRLAKDMKLLDETAREKLEKDIQAADIYRSVLISKSGKRLPEEYKRPVILV